MNKLENAEKIGLRDKATSEIIAVYPFKAVGNDEEVANKVRDWYYKQSCAAEDQLLDSFVDVLTKQEIEANK